MDKEFFMTFEAENTTQLNERIEAFIKKHQYEEINRSAPAVAVLDGHINIFVTSSFAARKAEAKVEEKVEEKAEQHVDEITKNKVDSKKIRDELLKQWK